ncbi:MAG: ABC transporter ATP-binding protein [Lachnospiraceae bacterium]|nr:ABC transporter ATP-binding protein [Lachnospiraceae bacterium]
MDENRAFLEVEDLTVHYTVGKDTVEAVNHVSFQLQKGKTLGLVGETGAGKTTIAKSIMRILPVPPAVVKSGKIYLDGQETLGLDEKEMLKIRGNKVSMIFQDPMTALNPIMTVGSQISEVISLHKAVDKAGAKQEAIRMLEMVGIPADRYNEYPHQFSGGMKQRVVIAMALACQPDLLLADEPTTALDVTIQAQVLDMIADLREKNNTSMIMITHDLGVVARVCDDVAVVYAGEVIESGSKEDIFDHPTHPYTIGLFGALPKLTGDEKRLHPIDGLTPDPTHLPKGCKFHPRCPHATEECAKRDIPLKEITPGHTCRCIKAEEGAQK